LPSPAAASKYSNPPSVQIIGSTSAKRGKPAARTEASKIFTVSVSTAIDRGIDPDSSPLPSGATISCSQPFSRPATGTGSQDQA